MNSKTNTVRAILLDASECDRPEADHPATIEICADDLQRILERHITEPAQCLHQIAEPAAQSEGEAFQALSELTNALRERHYGRMPAEVQAAYDKAWTIVFTGEKSAPAAPQAVQPAVPATNHSETPNSSTIIVPYGWKLVPDDATPEWVTNLEALPDWREAVGECIKRFLAAAPAHPAEGVPAMAAPFAEVLTDEDMEDFVSTHGFTGDFESMARIVEEKVLEKVAATQPAAQGLDAPNEWEGIHTMPTCDDLIWLYCKDTNTIDGPIAPDPSLEQYGWTHWAYANAPSTAGIDAAQAKQGGAA